jgi:sigma-B regulation protein RsbU (phosphoserine phosphatase)
LNRIASTVRKLINYDAFSILLLDEQRQLLRRRFSLRYDEHVDLDNIPLGSGITGAAVSSREPVVVEDTRKDRRYIEATEGIRSEVAVPLLRPDRVLGVMDLESSRVGFFTEADVRMLTLLAPLVTNSVENARLYEELADRESRTNENLRAARHLQSALLLREPPAVVGLDVAARSRPAHEVSGDVYDFISPNEDLEIITFGDVSGKGAAAALYGALVNGLLRTLAPRRSGPALLLKSVNESLGERKVRATYVTLLVLYWEHRNRTLRTANAGVLPPIVCRRGEILKQRLEGIPLGLLDEIQYDECSIQTESGDVLLLFSDGVYEQENAAGEEYGRGSLYGLLEEHWLKSPTEILDLVYEDMDRFRGSQDIADDQTVVVLKVT